MERKPFALKSPFALHGFLYVLAAHLSGYVAAVLFYIFSPSDWSYLAYIYPRRGLLHAVPASVYLVVLPQRKPHRLPGRYRPLPARLRDGGRDSDLPHDRRDKSPDRRSPKAYALGVFRHLAGCRPVLRRGPARPLHRASDLHPHPQKTRPPISRKECKP